MYLTNQTGMDIFLDEAKKRLYFGADVGHTGFGSRFLKDMKALAKNPEGVDDSEQCYDFYRGISVFEDAPAFESRDLRYDITFIMEGTINGELKKTSGHYHGCPPGRQLSYPEIYEVLHGRAMFVLQKPKASVDDASIAAEAEEFFFAEVREGESIIIPGGYGHCSINAGEGPLLFSNIAVVSCPLHYAPVKNMGGMAYFLMRKDDGSLEIEKNPRYGEVPEPRYMRVRENPDLGIVFGKPEYSEYVRNPSVFEYLKEPEAFQAAFLSMLAEESPVWTRRA